MVYTTFPGLTKQDLQYIYSALVCSAYIAGTFNNKTDRENFLAIASKIRPILDPETTIIEPPEVLET